LRTDAALFHDFAQDGAMLLPPGFRIDLHDESVDRLIARLARVQNGVISREQLEALGLEDYEIEYRLKIGRLHRLFRGVYSVGDRALPPLGRATGATLACGEDGALCDFSSIAFWSIAGSIVRSTHDVASARRHRRQRGLRPHQLVLADDEVTFHSGLRVTTPARAVYDFARAEHDTSRVKRVLEQWTALAIPENVSLETIIERYPRTRASKRLREIGAVLPRLTRSEGERTLQSILDAEGLPRPFTDYLLKGDGQEFIADCFWLEYGLIGEFDPEVTHRGRFHRDRDRDFALLAAHDYRTIRITDRMLQVDRATLVRRLRAALAPERRRQLATSSG
jgi:hypothetical protein